MTVNIAATSYGTDFITWGQSDGRGAHQGWMLRHCRLRNYWTSHDSDFWDTHERGGPKRLEGNAWVSQGGRDMSFPWAVMDDHGFLVPVPGPASIA